MRKPSKRAAVVGQRVLFHIPEAPLLKTFFRQAASILERDRHRRLYDSFQQPMRPLLPKSPDHRMRQTWINHLIQFWMRKLGSLQAKVSKYLISAHPSVGKPQVTAILLPEAAHSSLIEENQKKSAQKMKGKVPKPPKVPKVCVFCESKSESIELLTASLSAEKECRTSLVQTQQTIVQNKDAAIEELQKRCNKLLEQNDNFKRSILAFAERIQRYDSNAIAEAHTPQSTSTLQTSSQKKKRSKSSF